MKTILVPVDFSITSMNAARYAAQMSRQIKAEKLIIFHSYGGSYQILEQGQQAVLETSKLLLENLKSELDALQNDLANVAPSDLKIEYEITSGFLIEDALELIEKHNIDLVVMGITGKNTLEQKLIGTNTYRLASESPVPVLIVPSKADFSQVRNIALSLRFQSGIMDETPYQSINALVKNLEAQLTVLNVADDDHRTLAREVQAGITASHLMFDEEQAKIVYLGSKEIVKSVTEYINENDIQLLLSVTHKIGFLQSLFKGSITKQLAFYTTVPLMVFRAIED